MGMTASKQKNKLLIIVILQKIITYNVEKINRYNCKPKEEKCKYRLE